MIEHKELYALLDEANDCVLQCLNVEQTAKRPSYGAIHHLRELHERIRVVMEVLVDEDYRCLQPAGGEA